MRACVFLEVLVNAMSNRLLTEDDRVLYFYATARRPPVEECRNAQVRQGLVPNVGEQPHGVNAPALVHAETLVPRDSTCNAVRFPAEPPLHYVLVSEGRNPPHFPPIN